MVRPYTCASDGFYLHSNIIRIKTRSRRTLCTSKRSSIFIPIKQGLKLSNTLILINHLIRSIFIPIKQGLKRVLGLRRVEWRKFYLHSNKTRIKTIAGWKARMAKMFYLHSITIRINCFSVFCLVIQKFSLFLQSQTEIAKERNIWDDWIVCVDEL